MAEIFGNTTTTPINPEAFSGGGQGVVVEQTYNSESENAQSGKAVAEAVNGHKVVIFYSGMTPPTNQILAFGDSTTGCELTVYDGNKYVTLVRFPILDYMGYIESLKSPTELHKPVGCSALKDILDNVVGNIESALDELHTYAQALISGGAE